MTTAADAAEAEALLRRDRFDLVVLDAILQNEDGLSLCRRVTGIFDMPVILLTAMPPPTR